MFEIQRNPLLIIRKKDSRRSIAINKTLQTHQCINFNQLHLVQMKESNKALTKMKHQLVSRAQQVEHLSLVCGAVFISSR